MPSTAATALSRLRGDQLLAPVIEDRARLHILSARLDRAARAAVATHLSTRVRTDNRFAPVLGTLMRMALRS